MKYLIAIALIASTFATAAPSFAGGQSARDKGIAAYNARDYASAASLLQQATGANSKDDAAHYYLALTYQAMGRRSDAEREYRWNYENGTNRDLKYKSWQGLANLSRSMRSTARASGTTGGASTTAVAQVTSSPYASRVERGKAIKTEVNFVAGCPNHR